jgi:hypothetical protein
MYNLCSLVAATCISCCHQNGEVGKTHIAMRHLVFLSSSPKGEM